MPRVNVVPYDPRWPGAFEAASREVAAAIAANLLEIHHIGSTAIPGMAAKPVIDMLAVVSDVGELDRCAGAMETIGYQAMGEFGIAGRRYFRLDDAAGQRTHQVHAFQAGSPHVRRHIAFRDFLRTRPALARQYAELKQRLAAAHPDDNEAYMDGKDGLIKEIEARALARAG